MELGAEDADDPDQKEEIENDREDAGHLVDPVKVGFIDPAAAIMLTVIRVRLDEAFFK